MKRKQSCANHTVSGLVDKRTEIAGQMAELTRQIKQLKSDADALDTAILIFDPKFDLSKIKAKRVYEQNRYFKHGQMSTTVIDVVREHGEPITSAQILEKVAVVAEIDLDKADKPALKATLNTVLYRLRDQGIFVEHSRGERKQINWAIAD